MAKQWLSFPLFILVALACTSQPKLSLFEIAQEYVNANRAQMS